MRKDLSSYYYTALAAAIGLIAGFLGMFISNQQLIPPDKLVRYYYAGIILCALFAFALFLSSLASEAINAQRLAELSRKQAEEEIERAEKLKLVEALIPTFIQMTERVDEFSVLDDLESMRLEWKFTIRTDLKEEINNLTFPIYADLYEATEGDDGLNSVVEVERLRVNNVELSTGKCYTPLILRKTHPARGASEPLVEQGVLSVPVKLGPGPDKCSINIVLVIKEAYQHALEKEYVIIDIPYITDNLIVSLSAPTSHRVIKGDEFPIKAVIQEMQTTDTAETYKQSMAIKVSHQSLIWQCVHPKLGYRYKFYFRLQPAEVPRGVPEV